MGIIGFAEICHSGWAIGVGRRLLDELIALVQSKAGRPGAQGDNVAFQDALAKAEARYRSARAFVFEAWADAYDTLERGDRLSVRQHTLIRLALTNITDALHEVASFVYLAGGTTALRTGTIQRLYRDVHAGTQHVTSSPPVVQACGRELAGLADGKVWQFLGARRLLTKGRGAEPASAVADADHDGHLTDRRRTYARWMDLVELTAHLPLLEVEPGGAVVREGERTGSLFVLESGTLAVTRSGVAIADITAPGAMVGEIAALLGGDHSATVTAVTASRLRVARDGNAFLRSSPDVTLLVAAEVARRLQSLVAYLADLKTQYAGIPGLDMVSDVLSHLTDNRGAAAEPGSRREPDPLY